MYLICATVTITKEEDGIVWSSMRRLPSFFLDPTDGIRSSREAEIVARDLLNPFGLYDNDKLNIGACGYCDFDRQALYKADPEAVKQVDQTIARLIEQKRPERWDSDDNYTYRPYLLPSDPYDHDHDCDED